MNLHNNLVLVANTSLMEVQGVQAGMQVFGMDGKLLHNQNMAVNLPANTKTDLFTAEIDKYSLPANYLVRLWIKDKKGKILASNEYWKANTSTGHFKAFNQLPDVTLACRETKSGNGQVEIVLENRTKNPAIGIRLDAMDESGNILLPAYFSDGYFTLLPGEKRTILYQPAAEKPTAKIRMSGYNQRGTMLTLLKPAVSSDKMVAGTVQEK
jgi:hypothetical protein